MILSLISYLEQSKWNIGFIFASSEDIVKTKNEKPHIKWMRHNCKDRFFADPFIYRVTDEILEVDAEEYIYNKKRGRIVRLIIDRYSLQLIDIKVLLELESHLSYPVSLYYENELYYYPENGETKEIRLYKHIEGSLCYQSTLLRNISWNLGSENIWPSDGTILYHADRYYLFLTPKVENDTLLILESDTPFGPFNETKRAYNSEGMNLRAAGNFFYVDGVLFRPTQNCEGDYGKFIEIHRIDIADTIIETHVLSIKSNSNQYNRGIHTFNCHNDIIAVDGRGFRFKLARYILPFLYLVRSIGVYIKRIFRV